MTIMKMMMLSQVGLVLDSLDDIHCLTEAKQKEEVGRIERTNYKDDGDIYIMMKCLSVCVSRKMITSSWESPVTT